MRAATKVTLAEFAPDSIWFTSLGSPLGVTIVITGAVSDPFEGDYAIENDWSGVPQGLDDLNGTVNGDGTEWSWDGKGQAADWNGNTLQSLCADKKESR